MKKLISLVTIMLCTTCAWAEDYQIKGELPATYNEKKVSLLTVLPNGEDSLLTSGVVTDGQFMISMKPDAELLYIEIEGNNRIPVLLDPKVSTYLLQEDNSKNLVLKGGALQNQWDAYAAYNQDIRLKKDSLEREYRVAEKTDDLFLRMHIRAIYEELVQAQENYEDSLLKANDNLLAATIVQMRAPSLMKQRKLIDKFNLLGENARQTKAGKVLASMVADFQKMENDKIAPDFVQTDVNGKPISLYSIKAKLKLLDFWASWCGPCRAETPNLRKIYETYKDKGLEIISVSLDTKEQNWKSAIEKDQMNWIHTSDLKGWKNEVAQRYGVSAVPAIFLLDKDNHIIGRNLRGEDLEKAVKEYLENAK